MCLAWPSTLPFVWGLKKAKTPSDFNRKGHGFLKILSRELVRMFRLTLDIRRVENCPFAFCLEDFANHTACSYVRRRADMFYADPVSEDWGRFTISSFQRACLSILLFPISGSLEQSFQVKNTDYLLNTAVSVLISSSMKLDDVTAVTSFHWNQSI